MRFPSDKRPDKTDGSQLPNAMVHLFYFIRKKKKINFLWHPQAGAEGGRERERMCMQRTHGLRCRQRTRRHTHTPQIDSPWLLQSDQFCIQRRPRVNLLLFGNFLAGREMDPLRQSPGFQADNPCSPPAVCSPRPFPRCSPRREEGT